MLDIDVVTDAIVSGAAAYIDQRFEPLLARIAALEARPPPVVKDGVGIERALRDASGALNLVRSDGTLLNIGNIDGRDGRDVDLTVLREMVAQEVAQIPPAPAGRDADVAEVAALLKAELEAPLRRQVEDAIAAIPAPRDGIDADPEVTARLVVELVEKRFAALPIPVDGRDADPVVIEQMVADAVAVLPPAPAGRDADPVEIARMVSEAVAALPPAKDGRDADPTEIERMVLEAVAGLPLPPPGRDADPAEITRQVFEAVAALPPAKDGRDADPAVIERMVDEAVAPLSALTLAEVERAVAAIPKPQDGRSVTADDVLPLVERAVGEAVAALPPPPDTVAPEQFAALQTTVSGLQDTTRSIGEVVEELKAMPTPPASFLVSEAGVLCGIFPDGTTKEFGRVRGADGKNGASIMDGSVDDAGELILRMSDGRVIRSGTVRGADGKDGLIGPAGSAGRDAAELTILPGIDETRSYGHGVCARYRGGIIRAERQTDPIDGDIEKAGWGVILEGIAEVSERLVDEGRTIERSTVYTSGRVFTARLKTLAMIGRGMWTEGAYEQGDVVIRDGSSWICQTPTTDMPGVSADWKLVAKRGRDGKDGKPGTPGLKGADGKPGLNGRGAF